MKKFIIIAALLFCVSAYAFDEDTAETSGDVMRVLIPLATYSATFYNHDAEGRVQFYKSFFTNAGVSYGLKSVIKKDRPDDSGDDAFPSGHASMAFQSAVFLQKRYGLSYGLPAFAAAAYTSWTRVYADKHDVGDVMAGAAIGTVSALFFTTEYKGAVITPVADAHSLGISLTRKW